MKTMRLGSLADFFVKMTVRGYYKRKGRAHGPALERQEANGAYQEVRTEPLNFSSMNAFTSGV
ncbi:hypothetical protein FHR70_002124 [Microvirga lupini]|uniref:Uncharacterized protein n=1 Tax=Microvirga lupini TaxID=420324 RepID=A0A7W4YW44_9HYPH|nr:hypothetical protein [Microvirga lupini]